METDGKHVFVFENCSIRAIDIQTQTFTIMTGHGHCIRYVKVCQGYLWSACQKKVVQWDLDILQKKTEWNHAKSSGVFAYDDNIIVIQQEKGFLFGTNTPFVITEHEIVFLSRHVIVTRIYSWLSLFINHFYIHTYHCGSWAISQDRLLLEKQNEIRCWDLQTSQEWKLGNVGHDHQFSPDGMFIFMNAYYSPSKALIVKADTGKIIQSFDSPDYKTVWHPDSSRLLFLYKEKVIQIVIRPYQQQQSASIPFSFFKRYILQKLF